MLIDSAEPFACAYSFIDFKKRIKEVASVLGKTWCIAGFICTCMVRIPSLCFI